MNRSVLLAALGLVAATGSAHKVRVDFNDGSQPKQCQQKDCYWHQFDCNQNGNNDPSGNAYDVLYAAYKTAPIFTLYDVTGTATTNPANVRTIAIAVNVVSSTPDQQSTMVPIVSMSSIARLNN